MADGNTLLTDKGAILKTRAEHFNTKLLLDSVLNRPSQINEDAINRFPQGDCNTPLDVFPTAQLSTKQQKLLSNCHQTGPSDQMQYLQRSTNPVGTQR